MTLEVAPQKQPTTRFLDEIRRRLAAHPLAKVGPGLITGVADDDPSGIVTYTQAGSQFGFAMLWTMPFAWPLMAVIQEMCARIGRVTGKGLGANIRTAYPAAVLWSVVALLLAANTLNIAADVAAMGEVAELVIGLNRHLMTAIFVVLILGLQVFIPYHRYVHVLKWLTLSLIAYGLVLLTVHVPWPEVGLQTILPRLKLDAASAQMAVAIFGTTISPYLFFWQCSEEVEDMDVRPGTRPLTVDPAKAPRELSRIRFDTWSGMFASNAAAYAIILAAAVTLHPAGVTRIDTAAQAASALRPLAGNLAFLLFAFGILGVGMIGVPVLAGSAGYAASDAFGWRYGLERNVKDARGFYAIITISVMLALVIQYSPIRPMQALYWSAVINGVVAVPLTAIVVLLASNRSIMTTFASGRWARAVGWLTTIVMGAAVIGMFMPGG